jgi:hypothetical protein
MQLKFGISTRYVKKNLSIADFQPKDRNKEILNMEQPETGCITRRHLQQNAHK